MIETNVDITNDWGMAGLIAHIILNVKNFGYFGLSCGKNVLANCVFNKS
jgi:hypothetical protein